MNLKLFGHKTGNVYYLNENNIIGSGGEGTVYKTKVSNLCLKIFKSNIPDILNEKEAKLLFMCNHAPFDSTIPKEQVISLLWPIELLYTLDKVFVGYVMPLIENVINLNVFIFPEFSKKNLTLFPWLKKFNLKEKTSLNLRMIIAYNISNVIKLLHQSKNYIIVDCKPDNFLVDSTGKIYLLDSDSIQIKENNIIKYRSNAITDEYCPPERYTKNFRIEKYTFDENWDVYTYAFLIYKLLFLTPPTSASLKKNFIVNRYFNENNQSQEYYVENMLYPISYKRFLFEKVNKFHNKYYNLDNSVQKLFIKSFFFTERPKIREWSDELYNSIVKLNSSEKGLNLLRKIFKKAFNPVRVSWLHLSVLFKDQKFLALILKAFAKEYKLSIIIFLIIAVFVFGASTINSKFFKLIHKEQSNKVVSNSDQFIDLSGNYYGYVNNDFSNILYLQLNIDSINSDRYYAQLKYNIKNKDERDVFEINYKKKTVQSKTLGKGNFIVNKTNQVSEIIFKTNHCTWVFKK